MPTKYDDFKRWLFEKDRIDVIRELQHAFPCMKGGEYLLWSDFESALGQYDIDTVLNWGRDDLYITRTSIGNLYFDKPCSLLNIQLPDIIRSVFIAWVKSISIATIPAYKLPSQSSHLYNQTGTEIKESIGFRNVSIRPSTSPEREMSTGISLMPVVFFLCQLGAGWS